MMFKHNFLHAFLIALVLTIPLGCQKEDEPEPEEEQLEFTIQPRAIVRLPVELMESSGIAISGENRFWSHEDSGNLNELYCFDSTGVLLRTLLIENAENIDWEDITTSDGNTWFIGDCGNNNNARTDLTVYIIPNPETITENTVQAETIHFSLEDQTDFPPLTRDRNFDIEAIAWYRDSLFMFTKNRTVPFTGICKMYSMPALPGTHTAKLIGSYNIGSTTGSGRITAADINKQTGELVLLTKEKIVSFTAYPGSRFFEGKKIEYFFDPIPGQVEALAFMGPRRLYMTEEGNGFNTGYLYEVILP